MHFYQKQPMISFKRAYFGKFTFTKIGFSKNKTNKQTNKRNNNYVTLNVLFSVIVVFPIFE